MYTIKLARRPKYGRAREFKFETSDGKAAFRNFFGWVDRETLFLSEAKNFTTRILLMKDGKELRKIRLQSI